MSAEKLFPGNVLAIGTHAGYKTPVVVESILHSNFDERLQRQYPDLGTRECLADIPDSQKVLAEFSRFLDPNRSPSEPDQIRLIDFAGNPIFRRLLTRGEIQQLFYETYLPFHVAVRDGIRSILEKNPNRPALIFDFHNTPTFMLRANPAEDYERHDLDGKSFEMPPVVLSNFHGLTADTNLMSDLRLAFIHYFQLTREEVQIGKIYEGGFTTRFHGCKLNPNYRDFDPRLRQVVQIEFDRKLYVDQKNARIIQLTMRFYRRQMMKILDEIGAGYRDPEALNLHSNLQKTSC